MCAFTVHTQGFSSWRSRESARILPEDTAMKDKKFKSFGDLYRAAYAEPNPERKMLLLSQVRKALDEWEQGAHNPDPAIGPKTSQLADLVSRRPILAA
jgi:hypothetical protein